MPYELEAAATVLSVRICVRNGRIFGSIRVTNQIEL
jgi:hypothetical protein